MDYNEDSDATEEAIPQRSSSRFSRSNHNNPDEERDEGAREEDDDDDEDEEEPTVSVSSRGRVRKIIAKARRIFRE